MRFSKAFKEVRKENGMRLIDWNEDVIVFVQYQESMSKMTAPYLYVESRHGRVPWIPTMIELFSDEWEVIYYEEVV